MKAREINHVQAFRETALLIPSRSYRSTSGAAPRRSEKSWRAHARYLAYLSGALNTYHRLLHGECLTVLMFHRVLPAWEISRSEPDPLYTVTPELLDQILCFLQRNYYFVSLPDVIASLAHKKPLPRRPLLITFDDGWRDNLEWAAPVLRNVPWSLFVASDAVSGRQYWWQEVLSWALRSDRVSRAELWESFGETGGAIGSDDMFGLLLKYNRLPEARDRILERFERELQSLGAARHMLSAQEVEALREGGVAIGSHGTSHLPLTHLDNAADDLRKSKEWLGSFGGLAAISFPHGRYDSQALASARNVGFSAMFTSDPVLNACPQGWLQSARIGRIPITTANVSRATGGLSHDKLATQLYLRRIEGSS